MSGNKILADCANEKLRTQENTCRNHLVYNTGLAGSGLFWAPRCECKEGYKRLPNGLCVLINDPECFKLWKPSYGE